MTFYPQAYHPTVLDYIKVMNMGRESRVTRMEPKTPKVAKPAKKRYSTHLKHPTALDYAKPR